MGQQGLTEYILRMSRFAQFSYGKHYLLFFIIKTLILKHPNIKV